MEREAPVDLENKWFEELLERHQELRKSNSSNSHVLRSIEGKLDKLVEDVAILKEASGATKQRLTSLEDKQWQIYLAIAGGVSGLVGAFFALVKK